MSVLRSFRLLSWKYYNYRKYYWIWTVLEFFLPIVIVYATCIISNRIIGSTSTFQPEYNPPSITVHNLLKTISYDKLFYSPKKEDIRVLVERCKDILTSIYGVGGYNFFPQTIQVADEPELVNEISKPENSKSVGVVFAGYVETDIFSYKIRDRRTWNTSSLFVPTETVHNGPYFPDPYYSSGFAGLQYLLDLSFLSSLNSLQDRKMIRNETQFVSFPYPSYIALTDLRYYIPIIVAVTIIFSSLIILAPLTLTIIHERSSGLTEVMKLAGLQDGYNWLNWFIHTFLFGLVVLTLITFILIYDHKGPEYATIHVVELSLLWSILMLFFLSQLAFCFLFCVIFSSALLGVISLVVLSLSLAYGAIKVHDYQNSILVHLSCFCPVGAIIQAFERISYYEILEIPITWQYVLKKELFTTDASLGFVLSMFVVDAVVYLILTWYIDAIYPGKYGYQKSPLFFIMPKNTKPSKKFSKKDEKDEEEATRTQSPFVEPISVEADIGVALRNLKKHYGAVEAVKGVNMTMFRDEIYVIIGTMKSGKSTILSLITGTIEPTEGQVLYRGSVDLLRNFKEYKGILGYCPQDDRLFPYFTIIDHMLFYGMLKGGSQEYIVEQATQYLEWMGLYENSDDLAAVLSNEMKRKLSIAISLMGNSEILVIDEPTTALEPDARRRIWNLLSELKYDRTIVITSSSMQEAGIIGDRIAMVNTGVVVCEGSVKFLNEAFATGYELKVKKKDEKFVPVSRERDPIQALINLVMHIVPNAKAVVKTQTETIFTLPNDTSRFPELFKILEAQKGPLNIGRIGISSSTLEKVFKKVGGESIYDTEGKPLKLDTLVEEAFQTIIREEEKLTGIPLIIQQHKALFLKKNTFSYRTWYIFMYRVLVPTVLMLILIYGTVKFDVVDPPLSLSVNTYPIDAIEFYNSTSSHELLTNAFHLFLTKQKIGCRVIGNGTSLREVLLKLASNNILSYRRETLIAVYFNSTEGPLKQKSSRLALPIIAYNKFARHSLPIGVNTLTNTILASYMGKKAPSVKVFNHPIKSINLAKQEDKFNTDITETSPVITVWYLVLVFFTIDLLDFVSSPAIAERIDGFKQVQFLSSVSPFTYWSNTFMYDFLYFCGIMAFRLFLFLFLDIYHFFAMTSEFSVVILLLVLFIASGLLFMYLCSFILKTRYGAYALFTVFNICCTLVTLFFYNHQGSLFKTSSSFFESFLLSIVKYVIFLIPPLNFNLAVEKYLTTWRVNHMLEAYVKIETKQGKKNRQKIGNVTYKKVSFTRYLEFASPQNPNGILGEVLFLIFDILFYAFIIYNVEFGYIYKFLNKTFSTSGIGKRKKEDMNEVPQDVKEERDRVRKAVAEKKNDTRIYLIAQHLRKVYQPLSAIFSKQKVAVSDVSFIVKSGECFGIVGPNASGKTITFKMLAGEVLPTKGDSWILGSKLASNKTEYYSKAGYCAQKDSFLEELTGQEILSLVASLRGILPRHRQDTIERWVTILGLKNVITKKCSSYDDGNRRKICAALALIGEPEVVLLDEPTTRIDPVSRRSLYTAFSQIRAEGRSAVVSFHSMQECGTLCDRFILLIKGQMKFIGTADELTNKFGIGFTLFVIVKDAEQSDSDDSRVDDILQLKFAILDKFQGKNLVLMAESKGSVMYDVREEMNWSDVFNRMEALKKSLHFIESYQVSDKSLDEIFTALAKRKIK